MLNLFSGLMTCKKLIPLKFMAAQLAIELTLNTEAVALIGTATLSPTITVSNVNMVAELLDFGDTYDASFYKGMETYGVPLKFASWHFHSFATQGAGNSQFQIHERARSIKMAFAVVKDLSAPSLAYDSDVFYHDLAAAGSASGMKIVSTDGTLTNPRTNSSPALIS